MGEVVAGGAKNAALPIMAASILTRHPVFLEAVPDLVDVDTLARVLGHLGVEVKRQLGGCLRLQTVDAEPTRAEAGSASMCGADKASTSAARV